MRRSLLCHLVVTLVFVTNVGAAESLHQRIDSLVDAAQLGPQAKPASDAEFLRRVYLDFTGVIPTAEQVRKFLDDKAPDKRAKLIDELIGSPAYVRHMTNVFSLMLMERRSDPAPLRQFLTEAFETNKPWNQMAGEILGADGADLKKRGPVDFYFARSVEPNLMTREIGRIFFGMDLQCAQCHNHPLIDDYLQRDYYGIFAFLNRTYQFKPDKKKPAVLAEKPVGDVGFESVFTGVKGKTRPRLPGESELTEPTFKKGDEYKVKPDKKKKTLRPIPKYSRRAKLQELVVKGDNLAFRRNIVNRLWGILMGRGLVHPPDLHHSDNPPSHPELLQLLADEFRTMKFDIRAMFRELALTRTYQRSVELPDNLAKRAVEFGPRQTQLRSQLAQIEAERLTLKKKIDEAETARELVQDEMIALDDEEKKAKATIASLKKAKPGLDKNLAAAKKSLATAQTRAKPSQAAVAKAEADLNQKPDDKNRKAALDRAKAQLKPRQAAVDKADKLVASRQSAVKTNTDKTKAAEKVLASVATRRAEIQKRLVAPTQKVGEFRKQDRSLHQRIEVTKRRVDAIESMTKFLEVENDKSASPEARQEAYDALTKNWSEHFVIGTLEPLSPEQMAWSVMQATGALAKQRAASAAAINKKKPLKPDEQKDPAKVAAREAEIDKDAYTKLAKSVAAFVSIFGAGAGQPQYDFFATAEQALFFGNGSQVRSWLAPSGTSLTARLGKLAEPEKLADELYLSVLTRRPTPEEINDVKEYLASRPEKEKPAAIQEMVWALLTSSEFRFHH